MHVAQEGKRATSWSPQGGSALEILLEKGSVSISSGLGSDESQVLFSFFTPGIIFFAYIESYSLLSHHKSDLLIVPYVCLICGFFFFLIR